MKVYINAKISQSSTLNSKITLKSHENAKISQQDRQRRAVPVTYGHSTSAKLSHNSTRPHSPCPSAAVHPVAAEFLIHMQSLSFSCAASSSPISRPHHTGFLIGLHV